MKTEVIAGLSIFSTSAYILFVNPLILSKTGMDFSAVLFATIIAAAVGTLVMGLLAHYPFVLAPRMGMNAYFAYSIVLSFGHSWQVALGACVIASVTLFIMNILGIRQLIMNAFPPCLRLSVAGGIGLFLAFIGLKDLGIVDAHPITLVTVGEFVTKEVLLAFICLILISTLMVFRVLGAVLYSILAVWAIGLITGIVKWNGLMAMPPSPSLTLFQLDIAGVLHPEMISIVVSFIFIMIVDATGCLVALSEQGGFLDSHGKLPRARKALFADSTGSGVGALIGTSPLTIYLESAAGIAAGAKTGLCSVVAALLFLSTLFFTPLIESIPVFATAPVLIIIGAMMLRQVVRLDWNDPSEYIPAFITLISIPLTFSIATGIAFGFIFYPLIKIFSNKWREVHPFTAVMGILFLVKFIVGW